MFCWQKIGPAMLFMFFVMSGFSSSAVAQSECKDTPVLLAQNAPSKRRVPTKKPVEPDEDDEDDDDTPQRNRPTPPAQPPRKEAPPRREAPPQDSGCANQLAGIGLNICTQVGCQICDWKCQLGLLGGGLAGGLVGAGAGYATGLVIHPGDSAEAKNSRFNNLVWGTVIGGAAGATLGGIGGLVWSLSTRSKR